jgi:hypothetical protein
VIHGEIRRDIPTAIICRNWEFFLLLLQIWSLLPRFCLDPTDLKISFPMIARILGSALNERVELRPIVCHALTLLIKQSNDKGNQKCTNLIIFLTFCTLSSEESRTVLSRFSKNYLPILFNLYTDPEGKPDHKSPLMECIKAYVSISGGSSCSTSTVHSQCGRLKFEAKMILFRLLCMHIWAPIMVLTC